VGLEESLQQGDGVSSGPALAVHGMSVFPNLTGEQRGKGLTDFNDLALENPRLAEHQLKDALSRAQQRDEEQTKEIGKGIMRLDSWSGRREIPCEILKETPHRPGMFISV
jgi:hypothetical protein